MLVFGRLTPSNKWSVTTLFYRTCQIQITNQNSSNTFRPIKYILVIIVVAASTSWHSSSHLESSKQYSVAYKSSRKANHRTNETDKQHCRQQTLCRREKLKGLTITPNSQIHSYHIQTRINNHDHLNPPTDNSSILAAGIIETQPQQQDQTQRYRKKKLLTKYYYLLFKLSICITD